MKSPADAGFLFDKSVMFGDRIRGTSVSEYFDRPPIKPENLTNTDLFEKLRGARVIQKFCKFTEF
jgi:hypothetical protein